MSDHEVTPKNASGQRNVEAGPSDYWRRSPSPDAPLSSPPAQWRSAGNTAWPDDLEGGPSDQWTVNRAESTPPYHTGNGNGVEYDDEIGTRDMRDEMEFERRLEQVRMEGLERDKSREARHNDNEGNGDKQKSRAITGEEEFGVLNFPLQVCTVALGMIKADRASQDDQSSQAGTSPSTPSISIRNGRFGALNPLDTPSPTKRPSYIREFRLVNRRAVLMLMYLIMQIRQSLDYVRTCGLPPRPLNKRCLDRPISIREQHRTSRSFPRPPQTLLYPDLPSPLLSLISTLQAQLSLSIPYVTSLRTSSVGKAVLPRLIDLLLAVKLVLCLVYQMEVERMSKGMVNPVLWM